MENYFEISLKGIHDLISDISEDIEIKFQKYYNFLHEQNSLMNLTAITDPVDCANLHFLDSLALFHANDFKNASIIDIGSGAGFPGLPVKIAEPSVRLTLLDATAKRVTFLSSLCDILGDTETSCIHARAEEAAHKPHLRDTFDFALSRAVARLNILCELCLPFVRLGGEFLAMKGTDSDSEIAESENAAKTLGGEILPPIDYIVPNTDITHRIVIIRKVTETPSGFPRRFSRIQKSPL